MLDEYFPLQELVSMKQPGNDIPLRNPIIQALKAWLEPVNAEPHPLSRLCVFRRRQSEGESDRAIGNALLMDWLDELANESPAATDFLRRRFFDGTPMHTLANQMNMGEATVYRRQTEAIDQLTRLVQGQEKRCRTEAAARFEGRLERPTYTHLIGLEPWLEKLHHLVLKPETPRIISVEGLGGIGKTTLADAFSRQLIREGAIEEFAWLSARQHVLLPGVEIRETGHPALTPDSLVDGFLRQLEEEASVSRPLSEKPATLKKRVRGQAALFVIDNLESAADYRTLLPLLRDLVNPAKVILTSRHSLQVEPDVYCLTLSPLNRTDTISFIRQEATVRGITNLIEASDEQLDRIHQVTGGNPLALKLVVGQISVLPLPRVLESLRQAKGEPTTDLYAYIYRQAWRLLESPSRQLLLAMPLVQNGTFENLEAATGMDAGALSQAIRQLASLSLLQLQGTLEERRYTVHRLTETFLLEEALRWQPES